MARPSATGSPAASDASATALNRGGWRLHHWIGLSVVFAVGVAVRAALLPTDGLRDDIDQFAGWVHHIAANGLGTLYGPTEAGAVTFGPIMAYIWAALAALDPAFVSATDASDAGIRMLMKLPASIADVGLAALVVFALRDRPRWAVVAGAAVFLHPAVVDVGAWWGQYESIYLLCALAAAILAVNGRNGWAAGAIALALMTKPQALPLVVPFAAWFWATGGWRGLGRAALIGSAVVVAVWLPFIPNGGPAGYLSNLGTYQNDTFAIASLRAWNFWWLFQQAAAGGLFIADDSAIAGPITLRLIGYAAAGALELVVALAILRNPSRQTFFLALATAVLVAFAFLTQMHERYAYGALVFLALLIADPRLRVANVAFGIVFTLNLLAAIPPTPEVGAALPVGGWLGALGSLTMLSLTGVVLWLLLQVQDHRATAAGRTSEL